MLPGVERYSEALEKATHLPCWELLELDPDEVERPPLLGTGAVEAMLVTATQDVLGAVVRVATAWLAQRPNRTVKLDLLRDSSEVTDTSAEDQRRLIEAFLPNHPRR
jgi:hypothetical protein